MSQASLLPWEERHGQIKNFLRHLSLSTHLQMTVNYFILIPTLSGETETLREEVTCLKSQNLSSGSPHNSDLLLSQHVQSPCLVMMRQAPCRLHRVWETRGRVLGSPKHQCQMRTYVMSTNKAYASLFLNVLLGPLKSDLYRSSDIGCDQGGNAIALLRARMAIEPGTSTCVSLERVLGFSKPGATCIHT